MMNRELWVVFITMGALALIGLAVFVGGDRQTLVPPPEASAEGFVRQVVLQRYRQTRQYLASGSAAELSVSHLAAWRDRLDARSGHITKIDPSGVVMDDTRALAHVRVRGTRADADVSVPMRRERGLWKVDALPAIQEHPNE
jgi:hypothetical protein